MALDEKGAQEHVARLSGERQKLLVKYRSFFLVVLCRTHTSSGLRPKQERSRLLGPDPLHHETFPPQRS